MLEERNDVNLHEEGGKEGKKWGQGPSGRGSLTSRHTLKKKRVYRRQYSLGSFSASDLGEGGILRAIDREVKKKKRKQTEK